MITTRNRCWRRSGNAHKSCNDPHYSTNLHCDSGQHEENLINYTAREFHYKQWHDSSSAEAEPSCDCMQFSLLLSKELTAQQPGGSVRASILSSTTTLESVHNWLATNQVFQCRRWIWFVECPKMLWPFLSLWEFVTVFLLLLHQRHARQLTHFSIKPNQLSYCWSLLRTVTTRSSAAESIMITTLPHLLLSHESLQFS